MHSLQNNLFYGCNQLRCAYFSTHPSARCHIRQQNPQIRQTSTLITLVIIDTNSRHVLAIHTGKIVYGLAIAHHDPLRSCATVILPPWWPTHMIVIVWLFTELDKIFGQKPGFEDFLLSHCAGSSAPNSNEPSKHQLLSSRAALRCDRGPREDGAAADAEIFKMRRVETNRPLQEGFPLKIIGHLRSESAFRVTVSYPVNAPPRV